MTMPDEPIVRHFIIGFCHAWQNLSKKIITIISEVKYGYLFC